MHYLKIAAVGLVCAFSDVVVASQDNVPRNANLNRRGGVEGLSGYADAVTVTVTATLDPCICTASVPIHVTPAHYQTAAVPITSVTQAHLVKLPIGTGIPAGVHGSPVLEPFLPLHAPIQPPPIATAAASAFFSGKPQLAGTNATVTMSNLASAKSDLSKSSTKSFTAGASKHSSMTAFLLATFFAMSAKVLFL